MLYEVITNAENILTFNLNGSKAGYEGAGLSAFYAGIEEPTW